MQAVVWDYDGTLMDTYPMMTDCLYDALRVRGFEAEKGWLLDSMKETLSYAVEVCAKRFGTDPALLLRDFRAFERLHFSRALPLPGIPEAMARLHAMGVRQMLLTHRDQTALEGLKAHHLDVFLQDAVTAEMGFPRKPDPSGLRYLLNRAGISPEETVMVGDRPLDVQAGRAAGTKTCLLDPEKRFPSEPCSIRLIRAEDLPEWIGRQTEK